MNVGTREGKLPGGMKSFEEGKSSVKNMGEGGGNESRMGMEIVRVS